MAFLTFNFFLKAHILRFLRFNNFLKSTVRSCFFLFFFVKIFVNISKDGNFLDICW